MRASLSVLVLSWESLLFLGQVKAASPSDTNTQTGDANPPAVSLEEQARVHFEKGIGRYADGALLDALAEFRQSFELYPKLNAMTNATICLRELGRYDEALDLLERISSRFKLSTDERAEYELEVARLSKRVGVIDLRGAPPALRVLIDDRDVGSTPLGRRLRVLPGTHRLVVADQGRPVFESTFYLAGGQLSIVDVHRAASEQPGTWPVTLGIELGGLWSSTLGGDVAGCSDGCDRTMVWGGRLLGQVGYRFASPFVVSFEGGYMRLMQRVDNRVANAYAVGGGVDRGSASDVLAMGGALLGASLSYRPRILADSFFRVGIGSFFGWTADERSGVFSSQSPVSMATGVTYSLIATQRQAASYAYVSLGGTIGIRPAAHAQVGLGLDAIGMLALQQPRWRGQPFAIPSPGNGVTQFGDATLAARTLVLLSPSLDLRYEF